MSSATWKCPTCLRSVPRRAEACHCGTTRKVAQRLVSRQAPRGSGGPPWSAIGLVVAALGVFWFALLGDQTPAPVTRPAQPAATSSPTPSTPRSPPARRVVGRVIEHRPAPPPDVASAPPAPTPPPATPEPLPSEPTPEPTPDPDSVDSRRAEGEREFAAALSAAQRQLDELTRRLRSYQDGCRSSRDVVKPSGCANAGRVMLELLDGIDRAVSDAESRARRSWVSPGAQRDALRSHALDRRQRDQLRREVDSATQ